MDEVFRTKPEIKEPPTEKPTEITGVVEDPEAIPKDFHREQTLEDWEVQNGKYGHEYFGIRNIANEFPLRADFSVIDSYIKNLVVERGYELTPKTWHNCLSDLEGEIGTRNLSAYSRLQKLANYIKVLNRMEKLKKQKEAFMLGKDSSVEG